MSLAACIPDLIKEGKIDAERGQRMLETYNELRDYHRARMGGPAAEAAATRDTLARATHDAALRRFREGLALSTQVRMASDMTKFAGSRDGGPIAARAAKAVLVRDDKAPYLNFEYLWKAVRNRAHATLDQVLVKHRSTLLGHVRDAEGFDRVIDEMHGTSTGDLNAHEMADGARQALEMLRERANAAGADIGKLENYGVQHSHDSEKVEAAGYDAWREFVMPLLDRERMIDGKTGVPFTDARLDELLRETHRAISTDGWSRREPGAAGRPSIANALGQERFLHFRDGPAWRAYNDRFGVGSAYDALMNQIDRTSRDIALMETLGPNPAAGLRWLQDSVVKSAAEKGTRAEREAAGKAAKSLQNLYDEVIGKNREPYNRKLSLVFSTVRSWQVATKLGSATLSATSDVATQQLTRAFNGLPQTGTLSGYLKHLNPASIEDRAQAIRLGLGAEEYARRASGQGRMMGEELIGEIPKRVAEGVLRVSGLNALTEAGRWTFGKDFIAAITHNATRDFDQLNPGFVRALKRYGFDASEWDRIRATPLKEENGATWLQPFDIADRRLGDRVMAMIQAETDFAVPVGGLEVNALVHSAFKPGTVLGELGRTAFQFKSFTATVTMMHAQRMMALTGWKSRAGYGAALLLMSTIAGAIALQMKEIAKGKDPRPMDDWAFWGAAGAQGGGAGIYGDFLKSSQSRFGNSFTDVLKGPAWQTVDTLNSLTLDALWDAADPKAKVNYGGRVARALKSEVPGGSLWYARLAFERLMLDQMQSHIDPNYRHSWSMMERRARDQGNGYFWKPGELAPDHAPNMQNAVAPQTAQ